MKVEIWDEDLMILPETNFEESFLEQFKPSGVTLKCGMTPSSLIGLKIKTFEKDG